MLPYFTIIHPLVDACSVSVLVAGGMTWERVIAYNALAFALQLPLGVLLDAWPRWGRGGFFLGTGMVWVASVLVIMGFGGWGVLAMACVGNALFHLTAGKHVLEAHGGRSGPVGLFISTGGWGLAAGQVGAAQGGGVGLAVFAGALGACVVVAALATGKRPVAPVCNGQDARCPSSATGKMPVAPVGILVGLFVLIAWRSWAGLFASGRSAGDTILMIATGAMVTFAGKVAGGYLAERVGCWMVTAVSVAGSVSLAFFCEPSWVAAWLVLLFVAQLATGPVLSLVYDRSGCRGGTAFGLNCLGLFTGSLA